MRFTFWLFFVLFVLGCSKAPDGLRERLALRMNEAGLGITWVSDDHLNSLDVATGQAHVLRKLPYPIYGAQLSTSGSVLGESQNGMELLSPNGTREDWFSTCLKSAHQPEAVRASAISADGNKIVLVTSEGQEENILVISKHCRTPNKIASGKEIRFPSLSADGSKLVIERKGQIYLLDVGTGEEHFLVQGHMPALAPNGEMLTYLSDGKVIILDLKERRSRPVSVSELAVTPARWSPDESMLLLGSLGVTPTLKCEKPKALVIFEVATGQSSSVASFCEGFPINSVRWLSTSRR